VSVILSHPASLGHDTGAHPESAQRLIAVEALLASRDWLGSEHVLSPAVDTDLLELVHPPEHMAMIRAASERARASGRAVRLDADTVVSAGSYDAALHAAGGAVELVRRLVVDPGERVGFSVHRPPGHHAPRGHAMGFCLFNSIAVAARYAIDVLGLERVAIVDWDVHHGNGTQDIFWDSGQVLFCSIHQMPLYPGTGRAEEIGAGPGEGFTVNLPVPPGAGDDVFLDRLRGPVTDRVRAFVPDLLLVSAGFDAHADDPLAHCRVSDAGFAAMGTTVRSLAEEFQIPLGLVLEGGYDVDALARSMVATMEAVSPGSA
jgi:acetoin utilization deacetylase AcuC-like enzyme